MDRRKDIPFADPEALRHLTQTMIGQGLRAHYEVPQDTPEDMLVLTRRIEERRQSKQ